MKINGKMEIRGLFLLLATACVLLSGCGKNTKKVSKEEPSHFKFRVYDANTIRENPTTQIAITLDEWPGNTFLLWLPEIVNSVWAQWTPAVAHQDFEHTGTGGLLWTYTEKNIATVTAELEPKGRTLICTVRAKNLSDKNLEHVCAQNCLHLSQAPDFACGDFSRIYIRTDNQWKTLKELQPTSTLPMYYRPGFLESGKIDSWKGFLTKVNQPARADHPLMICLDKDNKRAVATVSEDYQCVFHNSGRKYLRCIHSQQAPVPVLAPGQTATFRQWIFFVDGGVSECLNYFDQSEAAAFYKSDKQN